MNSYSSAFAPAYDSAWVDALNIPPEWIVGEIEQRLPDIYSRVAANCHSEDSDPWLIEAVDAAVLFVIDRTNRWLYGLPNDPLTVNGLVLFGTRIYLDAYSPNGSQVAIADPSFSPVFLPENLWKHVRHYFMRLQGRFGIA